MNELQTQTNPTLPSDPTKALEKMIESIHALGDVYKRETEVLKRTDTNAFLEIQEEKLNTARLYQINLEQILERRAEMVNVNTQLKNKLEDVKNNFSLLMKENMEAINRMQRCTEKLAATMRNAAKEAATKQRRLSYGETGEIQNTNRKPVSTGLIETA